MRSNPRIYVYNGENTEPLDDDSIRIVRSLILSAYCDIRTDLEESDVELSTASCISLSREMDALAKLKRLFDEKQSKSIEEEGNDSE